MKKILLLFIVMVLLTGCGAFQKSENIRNWHSQPLKNEGEGVQRAMPLGISYDYYKRCKGEYENKIENGELIARNKGVIITIAKNVNEDVVTDLSFQSEKRNKEELLNEINTALKMSGMKEINISEFDEISNSALTKEETKNIDSGKPNGGKPNNPTIIDDIEIMKYASDEAPNGLYWSIVFGKIYK